LVEAISSQNQKTAALEKELGELIGEKLGREAERIMTEAHEVDGVTLYAGQLRGVDVDALRSLADRLRGKKEKAAVVLASVQDGKVLLLTAATAGLVAEGFSAVSMIKEIAPLIGGGGGGRPDLAQAGGKDAAKIPAVFDEARRFLERQSVS
jgi:alanyl-tRNA synthetase